MQASTALYKTTIAGAATTVEHQVTWTLPPASGLSRINLCTDPSFSGSTTLWGAAGQPPTLSLSTTHAFAGTRSLLVTWASTAGTDPNVFYEFATTPGLTYTTTGYVYVPTGSPAVHITAGSTTTGNTTLNDQWQRWVASFTATATTATIRIRPASAPAAGTQVYVDAVLIEQTAALGTYFDGDTDGAVWMGDPNRSTSQLSEGAYNDISLAVDSLTVDRQLTTDMPDGTRLVTGYPAASATITLSGLVDQTPGASKSVAWLLNPSNSASPLYRTDALQSPVTVKAGVYTTGSAIPETYTIFTGTVDDYTVDAANGAVTLTCLDARDKLKTAPPIPLGAFSSDTVAATYGDGDLGQMLTSGWVLNLICESIGRYTSPPPRNLCVYRQTNHGGAWPETGWAAAATVLTANTATVPGKFAAEVPAETVVQYYDVPPVGSPNGTITGDIGTSGDPWFAECWIQPTTDAGIVTPNDAVNITMGGSGSVSGNISQVTFGAQAPSLGAALQPYVFVVRAGGPVFTTVTPATLTVPNDGQWHYLSIAAHFTSSAAFTCVFTVDAASETAAGATTTANASNPVTTVNIAHYCPAESIQITNEGGTPLPNNGFAPSALVSLDASLNTLTAVPDITGQDTWAVIQQIAEAENGIAGFDELGVFYFRNRATLRARTSARTVTATYSLKTLTQEVGNSTVANHVQVPVNNLAVQAFSQIWSASSVISIGPGQTFTTSVTTPNPVVNLATTTGIIPNGGITSTSGYRAARGAGATGAVSNLLMTVTQTAPATVVVAVVNPNPFTVYLISPRNAGFPSTSVGQPALAVGGQLVVSTSTATDSTTSTSSVSIADVQFPAPVDGGAASSARGDRLLAVAANPWVQDYTSALSTAADLLIDLYKPRPLWRNVAIVADPTLQLGDRITVTDTDTSLVNDDAVIFGVHTNLSRTSWDQTLDLRAVSTPGGWVMGVSGRSEMGIATYM
jgi:hypothetical protein